MVLTRKFKLSIIAVISILIGIVFITVLAILDRRITSLERVPRVTVQRVVVVPTPTLTPIASPTASIKVVTPTKKTVVTPTR